MKQIVLLFSFELFNNTLYVTRHKSFEAFSLFVFSFYSMLDCIQVDLNDIFVVFKSTVWHFFKKCPIRKTGWNISCFLWDASVWKSRAPVLGWSDFNRDAEGRCLPPSGWRATRQRTATCGEKWKTWRRPTGEGRAFPQNADRTERGRLCHPLCYYNYMICYYPGSGGVAG